MPQTSLAPAGSRRPKLPAFLPIGGLVFILTLLVWRTGHFQFLELQAYDYFLREQSRSTREADQVAIVGITEEDIRDLNTYPVPVLALAEALEALTRQRPAAVIVDLYRDLPIPGTTEEDQARLVRCFQEHPNILAIRRLGFGGAPDVPAPPFLRDNLEQAGFNDFSVDYRVDDTARRVLLCMDDGVHLNFSVSMLATMLYLQTRGIQIAQDAVHPERFQLGRATLAPFESNDGPYVNADARGLQALLDFRGPREFPLYRFSTAQKSEIPDGALTGKVVLIGLMASSMNDHITTPLAKRFPGVLLHAHVINQLLRRAIDGEQPIHFFSEAGEAAWLCLWCAVGAFLGVKVRAPWLFVGLMLVGILTLTGIFWAALSAGWWLLVVAPATGFAAAAAVGTSQQAYVEKRQREVLMQLFSRHVSPDIAMEIWRQREQFMEGHRPKPQVINVSVFFSDLKGFTKTAEHLAPQELLDWLNEYMEMMAALIEKHHGMVIKYMGDAIMAAFGAPVPRTTEAEIAADATNAIRCALEMGEEFDQLNRSWQARGLPTTSMRIGIATGPVVSGSIGGSRRLEFTVTGDTVVTAKRLESARKEFTHLEQSSDSSRVLISEATARRVGSRFVLRDLGLLALDGKHEPAPAFAVLGEIRTTS